MILYDAGQDGIGAWKLVSDRVMGGTSEGTLSVEDVAGRCALRMTGDVSLENGGGFLQMARDMDPAPGWDGIEISILGASEDYNLHLRTRACEKPWQSFRAQFHTTGTWQKVRLPFTELEAHRTDAQFEPAALNRAGLVAIGRAFRADLSLSEMSLYREN